MIINTYFLKYKPNQASDWYEGFVQDTSAKAVRLMVFNLHPDAVIATCCKFK